MVRLEFHSKLIIRSLEKEHGVSIIMSKKGKFLTYFPTIAILIVSLAAFIPGIIASEFKTDLEVNKSQLVELQDTYNWMGDEAQYIFSHDSNLYGLAWQEIQEAKILDIEYSFLVAANQTSALVNITYMNKIINHLQTAAIITMQTISNDIWNNFNTNPLNSYNVGYSSSGFAYIIEADVYFAKPLYINTTVDDFVNNIYGMFYTEPGQKLFFNDTMTLLETEYSDFLDDNFAWLEAPGEVFSLTKDCNLYNVTQDSVIHLGDYIIETYDEIRFADDMVNSLETVVSIMTVATLLASAMASRLADRKVYHQISIIRSDIKDDKDQIIKEVDTFSVVILILAIILALAGLVFTLLPAGIFGM